MSATTGLNNSLDPTRIAFDFKTGVTELSQAINVNIDNSGRPSRRRGRTQKSSDASRCGFVAGGVCLCVKTTNLCRMWPDYSTTVLRSGLTLGARMSYRLIGDRIYYTNEYEKGYIYKNKNYAWEKGNYELKHPTRRIFSDPPNGHIVSWFSGRALMAVDNAICASEPSFYGVFNLHNNTRMFPDRVTMIRPTTQGLWVGTESQIFFYRGNKWREIRREPKGDPQKASYGVLFGSDVICPGEKLNSNSDKIMFTTPKGICTGSEDGILAIETEKKLTFPSGRYASAAIVGDRYLVLIEP